MRWARQVGPVGSVFKPRKQRPSFHSTLVAVADLEHSSPDSLPCAHLGNGMNASFSSWRITQKPGISSSWEARALGSSFSCVRAVFGHTGLERGRPGPARFSPSNVRSCPLGLLDQRVIFKNHFYYEIHFTEKYIKHIYLIKTHQVNPPVPLSMLRNRTFTVS